MRYTLYERIERRKRIKRRIIIAISLLIIGGAVGTTYFMKMKDNGTSKQAYVPSNPYLEGKADTSTPTPEVPPPVTVTPTPIPTPTPTIVPTTKADTIDASSVKIDESLFKDVVFVGDSITEGIRDFGMIDSSHVVADKGLTLLKAQKMVGTIVKKNPKKIVVLLGLNDILYNITPQKYAENYKKFIGMIQSQLPNTKIYVQTIFPVTKEATQKPAYKGYLSLQKIVDFNNSLKGIADGNKVIFMDIYSDFADANGYLPHEYTHDGIHLDYAYYKIWLNSVSKIITKN